MVEIPARFAETLIAREGEAGRDWITSLPRLIAELAGRWCLAIDGVPIGETFAIVIPVRRGDDQAVLKIAFPTALDVAEVTGLRAWDGRGVVRLLDHDPDRSTLLLERLDADRPLSAVPLMQSAGIAGSLIRRLAIPAPLVIPPDAPPEGPSAAPTGVPLLSRRAAGIAATLPARWEATGRPFPESLLSRAIDIASEIGPRAGTTLANWDLHHGNVLAGSREPWLVIDPMVVAGDPEVSVSPMVLRRVDEMTGPPMPRAFVRRVVAAGGLDPALTAAWLHVRIVDYWLWGLEAGLTEDPARCARLVDWLSVR